MVGKHTVYIDDVLEGLDKVKSNSIDLIITDPPYGVLKNGKTGWGLGYKPANWDIFPSEAALRVFTEQWFNVLKTKAKRNTFIFIFWSQKYLAMGQEIFRPHRTLIWRYNNLINNPKGDFAYDYEPVFLVKVGEPKLKKTSRSVLEFSKPQTNFIKDQAIYPTQKPRALIAHLLDVVGLQPESIVLDCFQGSGVVGEQSILKGLNYIGIDNSEDSRTTSEMLFKRIEQMPVQQDVLQKPLIPVQSTRVNNNQIHYFYTKDKQGKEHVYKRKTSGLWYDRDVKLLKKQLSDREEAILNEEVK